MPRNGSGTYSLISGNPFVTGTTISSTTVNTTLSDIATALTTSIASDGQTVPTANLPMGGFKHTGAAAATAAGQYLVYGQTSTASLGGSLNLSGTGALITGDFSNATVANRVMFQTSTANGGTTVAAIPNGTGTASGFSMFSKSDTANSEILSSYVTRGSASVIASDKTGTGTYLPMTFYTGGVERLRIDTSGNVGIGKTPAYRLDVQSSGAGVTAATFTDGAYGTTVIGFDLVYGSKIYNSGATALSFGANNGMNFQITSAGYAKVISATGLGFGAGSGGTVTQATSRTTSVTLNKPSGAITLVSAAGTSSWQGFIVSNNTVEATDTVVLSIRSGMTNVYQTIVQNVQSGGFSIFVSAVTGTVTESPVINFTVIKGAAT